MRTIEITNSITTNTVGRIMNGLNASKTQLSFKSISIFFQLFIGRFISVRDVAYLYFNLPSERFSELKIHLDAISYDFAGWSTFLNLHKNMADVARMAHREMFNRAKLFYQLEILIFLSIDQDLKFNVLNKMKLYAFSFTEKIKAITYGSNLNESEWISLINEASFEQLKELLKLPQLPRKAKSLITNTLYNVSHDNLHRLIETYHLISPHLKLRTKIISDIFEFNLEKVEKKELLRLYENEKKWTNLKRALLSLIEKIHWTENERANVLISKCHKDALLRSFMVSTLYFGQLQTIAENKETDFSTKRFILLAMCRIVKDSSQIKIIKNISICNNINCNKIINVINNRIMHNKPVLKLNIATEWPHQRLAVI